MHLSICSFTLSKFPSILPFHAQAVMLTLVWLISLVSGNAYPFKRSFRRSRLQFWKMSKILADKSCNNHNMLFRLPQNLAVRPAYQKQRPTGAPHNQEREVLFKYDHRGEARGMLFFCSFNQRRGLFHVS